MCTRRNSVCLSHQITHYLLLYYCFLLRGKLAVYHLRDAMRKERAVVETALQLTLFPLLKQFDPVLYDHMVVQAGLTLPTFAVSWISNWFATDVTDIAAASRLLDVFLVSHPTTPLYCAVAMLTCHRLRILQCKPILPAVYAAVRTLPLLVSEDASVDDNCTVTSAAAASHRAAMINVEQVICAALDYMYVLHFEDGFYIFYGYYC